MQGKLPETIEGFKEALRINKKRLGEAHPCVDTAHMNIGTLS